MIEYEILISIILLASSIVFMVASKSIAVRIYTGQQNLASAFGREVKTGQNSTTIRIYQIAIIVASAFILIGAISASLGPITV